VRNASNQFSTIEIMDSGRYAMRIASGITVISTALALGLAPVPAQAATGVPQPQPLPPPPVTHHVATQEKIRDSPSCADWVKYSAAQSNSADRPIQASQQAWLIGYLAGLASATETVIPPKITNEALYSWMDHYCAENPQAMVSNGAGALVFGIKEKGSL
jgi:hypothetical protein